MITMTRQAKWAQGVHHDGSALYVSNPLPQAHETVTLKLRTPKDAPINYVYLRAMMDGEFKRLRMERTEETTISHIWSCEIMADQPRIDYKFLLLTNAGGFYYNSLGLSRADSPDYFDFHLLVNYEAPLWVRNVVFYQIFPERFYNGDESNDVQDGEYERAGQKTIKRQWDALPYPFKQAQSLDFFGGDLQGITQKLDYLQDLGVTALYLCPVFSALTNHKYDVVDYFNVDKHFGGNEALAHLRAETEKRGMKLLLDITPNHIGNAHPWYQKVIENKDADTADFFYYDEEKQVFETWLGVPLLIKLNYNSPRLRDIMYRATDSVLQHWMNAPYRIDGWRLDVANMTGNRGMKQLDHEVWAEMRSFLKAKKPDLYLLGEYFQDYTAHLQGDELDASMNYQGFNTPMRRWLGGAGLGVSDNQPFGDTSLLPTAAMVTQWQRFMGAVPYTIALQQFNQLGSHDTTRILHVTHYDKTLVKLGTALLFAFPGIPCIYYGDEIGLKGHKSMEDYRRAMIWDEAQWDHDLRTFHQRLIQIRQESPALKHGGFQILHAQGDVIAFQRHVPEETIIVLGNRGVDTTPAIEIDVVQGGLADDTQLTDLLSDATFTVQAGNIEIQTLKHGQALILRVH